MANSQKVSFHGSHNPNNWVGSDYPSFVVNISGNFALFMTVNGEAQKLDHGTMFFIETGTSPPFNCEGFLCAFRLNDDGTIEFIGYESSLVGHLKEQYSSPDGLQKYWNTFLSAVLQSKIGSNYDDEEGSCPVIASVNNACWTAELVKFSPLENEIKV